MLLCCFAVIGAAGVVAAGADRAKGYYIPDPPDFEAPVPPGISGLWYDPSLDGEGYNVIFTLGPEGPVIVIFFYGYSAGGERLWLVTENIPTSLNFGDSVEAVVFEARGGTFDAPAPSAGALIPWGTIRIQFADCARGSARLEGADGQKLSLITKLAGIDGMPCSAAKGAAAGRAGLWFDASLDGEGYNVIASDAGTVVFFYGYNAGGERVWLISDVAAPQSNGTFTVPVFEAVGGTFGEPAPSAESLRGWGQISVDLGCAAGSITLDGADGVKTSAVVKLAGIQGAGC